MHPTDLCEPRSAGLVGEGVDVNAMLGVGGDVGYGGCEPRIEGIVQWYNIKGGSGGRVGLVRGWM